MKGFTAEGKHETEMEEVLGTRFNGHPEKSVFRARRLQKAGRTDEAIASLRKELKAGGSVWKVHELLGELLVSRGDYAAASEAYLSYPPFKNPDDQKVMTSNFAYLSGSRLFWLGRYEEARPLYDVSAWKDGYLSEAGTRELKEQAKRYAFIYSVVDRDVRKITP